MRIIVRSTAGVTRAAERLARRRLEFALGRFGSRVHSLTVRVTDLNGPRGGVDKQCVLAIRLRSPRRVIVIEDVDADATVAINRAADRAARSVARAIQALTDWRARQLGYERYSRRSERGRT